jgi:hypothetical protein
VSFKGLKYYYGFETMGSCAKADIDPADLSRTKERAVL